MNLLQAVKYYYFKNIYFKKYIKLVNQNRHSAIKCQQLVFKELISNAADTAFGREHSFDKIKTYSDFKAHVPVISYKDILPYTARIFKQEKNVLWPGLPAYFGKSSGTTNGSKYIPITNEQLTCTQFAARYMIANLVDQLKTTSFIGGKIFYQADPQIFEIKNEFKCASVSAIKSYLMPHWAQQFALPGKKINSIKDFDEKLNKTIEILLQHDIRSAVALPVWLIQLLTTIEKTTDKKFSEHFPSFRLLFLSGMNYEPYENIIRQHMGNNIFLMENYTATEGNFAYQVVPGEKGMELICNQGIFYEFIPLENYTVNNAERISLNEVEKNKKYVMIISNVSGLWAYKVNDIVYFVSIDPYRICVSGRMEDIFSPFGEHLLPIQAERAMAKVCYQTNTSIVDFCILPGYDHQDGHRYLCYIEFDDIRISEELFAENLHHNLSLENDNYEEFKRAGIFLLPKIIRVKLGFFKEYNKSNTVQQKNKHLVNDVKLIDTFNKINENN
ncbi:MAG: GH3 auxin-responsive promoter family protein [Ferruginibacter sp.]